jgi:hypothetical protein
MLDLLEITILWPTITAAAPEMHGASVHEDTQLRRQFALLVPAVWKGLVPGS